jgi:putative ABC transport system permease protein
MIRLAFETFRSRRGGILGAVAAVTLAVTLVASSGIVIESTLRAGAPVDRLAGAAVVVDRSQGFRLPGSENDLTLREPTRVDASLAGRLAAIPGVLVAVADRTFPTTIATSDGRPVSTGLTPGHGWQSAKLEPLRLIEGRPPRRPGDIVLEAELAGAASIRTGAHLRVTTGAAGPRPFTVTGIAVPAAGHGPSDAPAVFFRDDVARRLSGTGDRVELLGLTIGRGTDVSRVAQRARRIVHADGLRVLTGARRGEAESLESVLGREDVLAGLSVAATFSAFVAMFVIASAFALSVRQRYRELALLRAIGATPRQVRRMIAAEALVVAVAGSLLAVPLALLVATLERRAFVSGGFLPSDFRLVIGVLPFVIGLAAAIVTAQLAAFASGRRASRARPVDALREAAVERRPITRLRVLAGLAALAIGFAVFVGTAQDVSGGGGDDAAASGVVWMLAAVLLGPLLAVPFVLVVGICLEAASSGPGLLARSNARANLRGLTSIATPLLLTVSLGCALVFARAVVEEATVGQISKSIRADHVLVASDEGLARDALASVRRLPGVLSATGTLGTTAVVDSGGNPEELPAQAVDGDTLDGRVDLGVVAGSVSRLRGATVAVSRRRARKLGWGVGHRVVLWLGDGTRVRLRVVALFDRPLGFGEVVLPRSVVAGHVARPLDDAVFVRTRDGGAAGLERLAAGRGDIETLDRDGYVARVGHGVRKESIVAFLLLGLVVVFAAVAAVNALSMAISERARELELLRLIGASRRQLRRMIRFEVLLIVAFATVVGMLTAAPGVIVFSYGKTGSVVPQVPLWLYGALPVGAALLALAASVPPTRRALQAGRGSVTAGLE